MTSAGGCLVAELCWRAPGQTVLRRASTSHRSPMCRPTTCRAPGSGGKQPDGGGQQNNNPVQPRRIQDTRQMGLKQQLRAVKLIKEFEAVQSTGYRKSKVERSSYRKFKDKDEDAARERRRLKKIPLMATRLYGTDGQRNPPVLLVDGYNVVGAWAKLAKRRDRNELLVARDMLMDEMTEFSAIREIRVVVVFDAIGGRSKKDTRETTGQGLEVVYTGTDEADSWIERECRVLADKACPHVFVATSDNDEANVARGLGAYVWSSKMMVQEVKRAKEEVEAATTGVKPTVRMVDRLDGGTGDKLRELRAALPAAPQPQRAARQQGGGRGGAPQPSGMAGWRVQAVSPYNSHDPTHMTLKIGDVILVTDDNTGGRFWRGVNETRGGERGRHLLFPSDHTVPRATRD